MSSARENGDARRTLSVAHAEAEREMRSLHEEARRHLVEMETLLKEMDEDVSPWQLQQVQQAYTQLRYSFDRTKIALMDTQTLQHEWEDWQRTHEMSAYQATPEHEAREEMVRSELVLRGVRIQATPMQAPAQAMQLVTPMVDEPVMIAQATSVILERDVEMDHLDEWEECFGNEELDVEVLKHDPKTMEEMQASAQAAQMLKVRSGHQRMERRWGRN